MTLELVPVNLDEAKAFVRRIHRHLGEPAGAKWAIGAAASGAIVGVVIVGRPVARNTEDTWTAEVIRLATDGTKNACSMLYGAAWRAARAMGYRRLQTFTLKTEPGTSLMAAGWKIIGETRGKPWGCQTRPRVDTHPEQPELPKWKWAATA